MKETASLNPYATPLADQPLPPRIHRTFCGLQPRWATLDRFYKIYITDAALYAGWIGGQFQDKLSVRCQLSPLYLVLIGFVVAEPIAALVEHRRRRLEARYDTLITAPDQFLAADRRNFVLARKNVKSITVSPRKSFWTLWANSGVIDLTPHDGAARRILVRDSRDLAGIAVELHAAHYPVTMVP